MQEQENVERPSGAPSMDFLQINASHYGIATHPSRCGGGQRAHGDDGVMWFLAFEKPEDAQAWYDVSAMEF